jgi:hypothetical protein
MRLRFSLLASMLFIFFAAICIAALASPTPMTSALMHTVRLCFLFASILGAVLQRSQDRAFWTGFAVFGWGFLGLADIAWWARPPFLVTSHLLWWHEPSWVSTQNLQCFYENWDSIENLIMAAVGGLVGYLFGLRRDKRGMGTITSFTLAEQDKR